MDNEKVNIPIINDTKEMIVLRAVYDARKDGLLGRLDYYQRGASRYYHEQVRGNLASDVAMTKEQIENIDDDLKFLSKEKYPVDITLGEYEAKKFVDDLNDLVKTNAGRRLFNGDVVVLNKEYYDAYMKVFDKIEGYVDERYGIMAKGGSIENENNEMLENQIREIEHHSKEIDSVVTKKTRVEPWVIAKTERAATDLSDVTHYLDGEKYVDGGEIKKIGSFQSGDDTLIYMFDVNNVNPSFYHKLVGTIQKYDDNEYWATYEDELWEDLIEKTFKTFDEAEKWVFEKINLDKEYYIEYSMTGADKMSTGGSMYAEGGGVSFTDYKGESIMFEPHFNEYYVGDAGPFSTMDEAKAHIDGGSPMSSSMRGAYERGLFAKGGKVGIGMMAWRGREAYNVVGYDDSMDRWVFQSTTSGMQYLPKQKELKEFEFIKPKKMTEGGEIKVGDEFLNTERGEKFYIDKVDFSDKSYPFYVLKSSPNDYPEVIGRNEFERYYKAGLYEKYSGGGSITKEEYIQLLSKYDKLGAFLEDADNESERKRLKSEMDEVESKIISFERNKMATGGGVSSENAEKIAKLEKVLSSTLVPDSVKEKARMEIERLKSETTASDSGLSAEQRDLNKKAIALVDKAKIVDFKALVSEALTDANYHSSAFKFAQLVDSSIKTKEDWYKAEDFEGDEKTRDAGIQIANMCGWDGDEITETLYFVLKMKGEHKLADTLKKAMEVEEASYPNAITELTKRQTEYTQEIANRSGLRQGAVAEFVAKNGLTETETLNIVQGLGMGKLKPYDVMSAVIGVPHNEIEKQVLAFAKSNEAFKSEEPKSIRTVVEPETKPSIRTAVVEVEKEQPKVSDDRLKGKNISDVSKYVPHRNIESITFTIDGKSYTVKGSDIFDGIYVENNAIGIKAKRATKAKQPKVTRTQFEEETFEFAQGGYTRPTGKVSGIYDFAVKDGITNLKVVGFERQNDTEDSLYFDDSEKSSKTKFGSILVKNNAMSKLTKGKTVMAVSSTGIRGKLTRVKDLF